VIRKFLQLLIEEDLEELHIVTAIWTHIKMISLEDESITMMELDQSITTM
jgi:hypothetical protein